MGFTKLQLSIYSYYCQSKDKADWLSKRITAPENGQITIFFLTDKQFGMVKNYYGKLKTEIKEPELFNNLD